MNNDRFVLHGVVLALFIALVSFLSNSSPIWAADTKVLSGTIRFENGEPASGIHVLIFGNESIYTVTTDDLGGYSTTVVAGYSYTIYPTKYVQTKIVDSSIVSGNHIVDIASQEIGETDSEKYHAKVDAGWCSEFVSWVYYTAGDPFTGGDDEDWVMTTVKKIVKGFGLHDGWQFFERDDIPTNIEPQPGDYVFMSNNLGIDKSHSGIVWSVDDDTLVTIEGNYNDSVARVERNSWRSKTEGTIVRGIGFRRIISAARFEPTYYYVYSSADGQDHNFIYSEEATSATSINPMPFLWSLLFDS